MNSMKETYNNKSSINQITNIMYKHGYKNHQWMLCENDCIKSPMVINKNDYINHQQIIY